MTLEEARQKLRMQELRLQRIERSIKFLIVGYLLLSVLFTVIVSLSYSN